MGLVNRVLPDGELEDFVRSYAAMIGENAPLSLAAAKGIIAEVTKAVRRDRPRPLRGAGAALLRQRGLHRGPPRLHGEAQAGVPRQLTGPCPTRRATSPRIRRSALPITGSPDFLIDTVELAFELGEDSTTVKARLALRRNPAATERAAPLRLDGEELELVSLALDGETLGENRYRRDAESLVIAERAGPLHARHRDPHRAAEQHALERPLQVRRQFLHPVRARGIPPHHLFHRPARRDGALHHDRSPPTRRAIRCCCRTAIRSASGESAGRAALGALGRSASRSPPISSRSSPAMLVAHRDSFTTRSGKTVPLAIWVRAATRTNARHAMASLKAAMKWDEDDVRPRIRSRRLQHRRRQRLQHGRDGEQGPQHLQHEIRAGQARDRDRHRLPGHRIGHRTRVFPQLDRRPRHLPRLVPALAQGRAHRLPRPGILGRPGQPRRCAASATCAACARRSSPRMRGRSPIRCSPPPTSRSTISTPRPSTTRAPSWCA